MNPDPSIAARRKVKSLKRLYIHCALFVIISMFFFILNILTDPWDMWFFFPILPWAALVAIHYVLVKGVPGTNLLTKEWEEEEYERQLDLLQQDPLFRQNRFLPYEEVDESESLRLRKLQKTTRSAANDDFV